MNYLYEWSFLTITEQAEIEWFLRQKSYLTKREWARVRALIKKEKAVRDEFFVYLRNEAIKNLETFLRARHEYRQNYLLVK